MSHLSPPPRSRLRLPSQHHQENRVVYLEVLLEVLLEGYLAVVFWLQGESFIGPTDVGPVVAFLCRVRFLR